MVDWLKARKSKAPKRGDVIVLHSTEGGGKTSFAAQFKDAAFMMSENETGLLTLMARGLVPDCQFFPELTDWNDVQECTMQMVESADRPRTLAVDTSNGIESLLHNHVCQTQYDGEMTKKGFLSFGEGPKACLPIWRQWLARLDALRNKGTTVLLLCHTAVVNYKNPTGPDYHRFVAEMHETTWSATKKFADMIAFVDFHAEVGDVSGGGNVAKRGKGKGGRTRVFHFERSAAWDAKHRHGVPAMMKGTGDAHGDYLAFVDLVKQGKTKKAETSATVPATETKPEPAQAAPGK